MEKNSVEDRINWGVVTILFALPIFMVFGCVKYGMAYGCGWQEFILAVVAYYMANISVGLGTHRLWSHGSYKTTKFVEFILMVINSGTLQGPVLGWVSEHRRHHAFADTEKDPHTPLKFKSKIKGFIWSHVGWMCRGPAVGERIDRGTMATVGKCKMLRWQLKNYIKFATFMNIVPPIIFGWAVFGAITLQSSLAGLFFVGLGRALQQQMTFCVNSVCHMIGTKKYVDDSSRDIWWLCFFLLGENWHNFHHAFGRDYRNGHKWYHFDVHKWLIALLEKCGLAWDLVRTSPARIEIKMAEMRSNVNTDWHAKLQEVNEAAVKVIELTKKHIASVEKSANEMADTVTVAVKEQLDKVEELALNMVSSIKNLIESSEAISAQIVDEQMKKLRQLKRAAINAGIKVQI